MITIEPQWPAPANIRAYMTTRIGGVSQPPFSSLNLGDHVGDDSSAVSHNRALLQEALSLPSEPYWLKQTHSHNVVTIDATSTRHEGDASYTSELNRVCAVLTADCLPLLITNRAGDEVAAVHAGWRGLVDGVVESAIARFNTTPSDLLVWMGAAIGANAFEVGEEVYTSFVKLHSQTRDAFTPSRQNADKWFADIYQLARIRLESIGVESIYGGDLCTYSDDQRFYSYRRDGICGRMASLIWIDG